MLGSSPVIASKPPLQCPTLGLDFKNVNLRKLHFLVRLYISSRFYSSGFVNKLSHQYVVLLILCLDTRKRADRKFAASAESALVADIQTISNDNLQVPEK